MIKPKNIAEKIRRVLEPDKNILLVYLFGSAVTGKYHAGSDIDIGVLLRSCPDRLLCAEESLLLSDKLANLFISVNRWFIFSMLTLTSTPNIFQGLRLHGKI
ncbi:MAG: nucleotidyltransferase domain-containing protein [Actinomycetota bacterium]|nr:nucleotidyltransferase domain-containing protein [Actinomycetota bacterium]